VVATAPQSRRRKLAGSPSFPQIITARPPHRDPPLLANLLTARSPRLSPWHAARPQSKKTLFLARPGRIATTEIDFRRASPKPLETFMIEIAISCDMSQTFGPRMNSDPKQKRESVQQLAQNPKVKTGKVFGADLQKSKIHPTVKKLTAWRKLNRLSQRKAVAVLAKYYFHATFASLRSWEEGRRSPNSHTAAILERFLLDHPSVERPKK
jgi:DNA-binding transcriptional regulator YiaG